MEEVLFAGEVDLPMVEKIVGVGQTTLQFLQGLISNMQNKYSLDRK